LLVSVAPALAQEEASASDRASAAEAYDRGTAAYLHRDYERAATWFETANRLAPAPAAILQAIRAHGRAGNEMRAASLAAQAAELYPDDRSVRRRTRSLLDAADQYLRVRIACDAQCSLEIDGGVEEMRDLFLEAGAAHQLTATFSTGSQSREVRGEAGETVEVSFEAPPAPVVEEPDPIGTPTGPVDEGSSIAVIPWWVTAAAGGVTLALAATLIWSGVDALDGVPAYEAMPTMELLQDGQAREERTNWLIGATALMGVATAALAVFTDWEALFGGDSADEADETGGDGEGEQAQGARPSLRFSFGATPEGASASLGGRF
jgi:hypothetical protein